jgi:hypothetical protein
MGGSEEVSILPEVRALLSVISRLAPVRAVVDNSAAGMLPISVCFEDSQAFRPVIGLLKTYRGNFRWMALTRLPYVCLVPVLHEHSAGISMHRLQTLAMQDLAALTSLFERSLNLHGLPGKGLVVEKAAERDAEHGPRGPALLVADPQGYLSSGLLPTSGMDRTVEFWITDEEGDLMYDRCTLLTVSFRDCQICGCWKEYVRQSTKT